MKDKRNVGGMGKGRQSIWMCVSRVSTECGGKSSLIMIMRARKLGGRVMEF